MMASRSLPWDALQFMTKNGFLSTWEDASRDEGPEHLACLGICCVDDRPDHPAGQQDLVDVPDEPLEFVIGHLGPAPEVGSLLASRTAAHLPSRQTRSGPTMTPFQPYSNP